MRNLDRFWIFALIYAVGAEAAGQTGWIVDSIQLIAVIAYVVAFVGGARNELHAS